MLYVLGTGVQGYCEILEGKKVNELGLEMSANSSLISEPENLVLPEDYIRPNDSLGYVSRRKRSIEYVVPIESIERGGLKRKIVVMVKLLKLHIFPMKQVFVLFLGLPKGHCKMY